jgi:hypothetical protein
MFFAALIKKNLSRWRQYAARKHSADEGIITWQGAQATQRPGTDNMPTGL